MDDGFTNYTAVITLFENTKYLLKDNGIYIIEDFESALKDYKKYIVYFSKLS